MRREGGAPAARRISARFLLVACLLAVALHGGCGGPGAYPSNAVVQAVIDGDTILLDTGEKVRYLGVDCPETDHHGVSAECCGPEAKKMNAEMVLHKKVRLEYEKERMDDYGRVLAYVFLPDGRCANAELLRSGLAWVYRPARGLRRLGEFVELQREAVRRRTGMWGRCEVRPAEQYFANVHSYVFHRPDCPLGRDTARKNLVRYKTRWECLELGFRPCRVCKP